MIWRADGYHIKMPPNAKIIYPGDIIRGKILQGPPDCDNGCPDGPGPPNPPPMYAIGNYPVQGYDDVGFRNSGNDNGFPIYTSYSSATVSGGGGFSFVSGLHSATFWINRAITNCAGDLAGSIAWAYAAAQYVVAHAGQYSTAVYNSAITAINKYRASGLGVAAAAEFMAGFAASITAPEWGTVLGAIGLGALFIYGLWHCVSTNH